MKASFPLPAAKCDSGKVVYSTRAPGNRVRRSPPCCRLYGFTNMSFSGDGGMGLCWGPVEAVGSVWVPRNRREPI
jgi:hypothetical protein